MLRQSNDAANDKASELTSVAHYSNVHASNTHTCCSVSRMPISHYDYD